ncbi:murein hydrolase activator EnvC family protein [Paenibacillus sp. FA6]|uniref:murein hydrolase activator EnvC family protein n=1 Tax=Paenibacillus sp. FA6 TaxID=3413029 RepID=UPI003F655E02
MKKINLILVVILAATMIFQPTDTYAKKQTVSQIEKELKVLQERAQQAKKTQEKAASQKVEAQHYKEKNIEYLHSVLDEIDTVTNKLADISGQLDETKESLTLAATELDAAEERIATREVMLESRVRLMYTDGTVSYLEVLMASTSFSDFLVRADSLKMIVDQDQNLLVEHKKDKDTVVVKTAELELQYAKAETLYSEVETQKDILSEKEAEKKVLIAQFDKEIEESNELTEEQELQLVALASERSTLLQTKNKLVAEEAARVKAAKAAAAKRAAAAKAAAKITSKSKPSVASFSGGGGPLMMPVGNARISSGYGKRTHPVTGVLGKMHNGVDFAVPQGTTIHAAESGTIILAEWYSGYGNAVIVDHGGGMWTLYGHIRQGGISVKVGDRVSRGQKIAESGNTGQSTGPHLHFEVRINGSVVNPMPYI